MTPWLPDSSKGFNTTGNPSLAAAAAGSSSPSTRVNAGWDTPASVQPTAHGGLVTREGRRRRWTVRQAQSLGSERRHRDPGVIDRDNGVERHLIRELDDGVRRDLGTVQRQLDHARTNHVVKRVTLLGADHNR